MLNSEKKTHCDEIRDWLERFELAHKQTAKTEFRIKNNAAEELDKLYWNTVKKCVKNKLCEEETNDEDSSDEKLIDRHKIASTMEMCIMYFEPIEHMVFDRMIEINAQFAHFAAKSIILAFNFPDFSDANSNLNAEVASFPNFDREHISWLTMVEKEHFPIFSNAATWFLYERLLLARNDLSSV